MIHYVTGDILEADVEAIVNTVNCEGVMGKGLALQVKKAMPSVFAKYKADCLAGKVRTGRMHVVVVKDQAFQYVINFPTKKEWRNNSKLSYIRDGLQDLRIWMETAEISSIAIPMLGCANGGLNWEDVCPMIVEEMEDFDDVDIYVYGPAPKQVPKAKKTSGITVINKHHGLAYDEYAGRGSKWGNPFSHQKGTTAKFKVATRKEAVASYRRYILKTPALLLALHELKDKKVACFCAPDDCHVDVIKELVEDTFFLVIAGGRDFKDYEFLKERADYLTSKVKRKIVVVSGKAPGADSLGERWAKERGYDVAEFPADWKNDGKGNYDRRAGMVRNEEMARLVANIRGGALLFWDGRSKGTGAMRQICMKKGIQLKVESY